MGIVGEREGDFTRLFLATCSYGWLPLWPFLKK
jgi:hypothetical protein